MLRARNLLFACIFLLGLLIWSNLSARSALFTPFKDMFDQLSLKPQEEGSVNEFVVGAVSVDGSEIEDPNDRFNRIVKDIISETATINPIEPDAASLADGKLKYDTFCVVCHGATREYDEKGFARTKVNELGMIAPAVIALTPFFNDGYIYHKTKYGGAVMPAMGYAVTARERWNIVNYIRQLEKRQ
jgi:mono/diheme cytochrome c family protein